ncbi:MAG: alpha-E domain-containing protein [Halieaceae bacterium]|jgi:uncharacterized alpha-E superfamily protein|nr:alpha-E domain-containing protein [Halieaceae bacterium]
MLSRVAERAYWLARYLERAEDTARLILVRHNVILDLPKALQPEWELLLDVLSSREEFTRRSGTASERKILGHVFADRDNPSSILSSLTFARENMRTSREVLPSETWERVNSLYLSVARRANKGLPRASRHTVLNNTIHACQQIAGMLSGSMSQDEAYHFIKLGRCLERADMTTRIIDVASAGLGNSTEDLDMYQSVMWVSVLQSLSAYQMYRLNVRHNVRSGDVQEFLLRNKLFPRAVMHCLLQLEDSVSYLPRGEAALKAVRSVKRKLGRTRCDELDNEALHLFLDDIQKGIQRIHTAIQETWFTPEQR